MELDLKNLIERDKMVRRYGLILERMDTRTNSLRRAKPYLEDLHQSLLDLISPERTEIQLRVLEEYENKLYSEDQLIEEKRKSFLSSIREDIASWRDEL